MMPGVNSLRLLGNRTDLKKGERLLFVGQDPDNPQRTLWRMAQVTSTAPNVPKGFTVVTWESAPGMPADPLPYPGPYPVADPDTTNGPGQPAFTQAIAAPQLFVLRQKSKLFPYAATGVYRNWPAAETAGTAAATPPQNPEPEWWPAGIGLPHEPVELMRTTRSGHLLAVTKKDIHRSMDAGATWQPAGTGLSAKHVTALTVGDDGALYAGTDKGEVHLSQDEGATWRQAAGTPVRLPVRGLSKLVPAILQSSGHLPEVVVSSLAAYRSGSKEVLAAGTDSGVFLSTDRGQSWKTANLVLPKLDRKTGMAKVNVQALAAIRAGKRRRLYAGTDAGVFPIRPTPSATPVILAGLVLALLYRLFLNSGGVLTKTVYQTVVRFIQHAGKTAADLLSTLSHAIAKIPLVGNPIATPAAKLIGNLDKSILTPIAQLPATIPAPTATPIPAVTAHAIASATATVTASPTATATATAHATASATAAVTATPTATATAGAASAAVLPKPVMAVLGVVDQYPVLWFFVDAALIAAAIGAVIVAWWLIWRFLNNRPARRIAGTPPPAKPAPAVPGKLPGRKDLAKELSPKNPPVPVRALQASTTGLYAGTAQGVYHALGPGPRPPDKWLRRLFSRLAQLAFPGLLSGWTHLEIASAPQPDIRTLAMPDPDDLLATAKAGEIYRYHDDGNTWQPGHKDSSFLPLAGIAATVAASDDLFLGGTPPQAKVDPQWSPWQLQSRAIHLDTVHDSISPKSWLVLESAGDAKDDKPVPLPRLFQAVQAERSDSHDAVKGGQFSRVTVDRDDGLAGYDRTTTQALFQSESLELYDDTPVFGTSLQLNRFVSSLKAGQYIIVSGKRMRARLVVSADTTVTLTSADGLQTADVQPGESLVVLKPPQRKTASSDNGAEQQSGDNSQSPDDSNRELSTDTWYVLNRDGIAGQVEIPAGPNGGTAQFVIEPPLEDDPEVSELAVIQGIAGNADQTTLTLATDLTNIFERPTVTVRANVVRATHGATVPSEVLGSSDGSQGNQRFVLRQAPLTYISSATPEGLQSTLTITVAGVRWHQVPFLYGHPRDERAYAVQLDEQDHASVTFGDGRSGARLPSTREEVRASYRIGIGQPGNVPASSLTQLRSAPHGLAGVTNPLPASGGVDPEANDSIRANAPLKLRAMNRIVSLSDYEDFVRAFAGIGQVRAKMFHRGQGGLLHITVADGDGNPLDTTSALYTNVVEAVERARVAPTPKVRIDSYEAVYFNVAVKVMVDHDYQARQLIIEQQARQAVSGAFAFQRREFAQNVSAAEIINLLQPIQGVVGVEIERLACHPYGVTGVPTLVPAASEPEPLVAFPARLQNGAVLPAQILLINTQSPDGIIIDVEFVK